MNGTGVMPSPRHMDVAITGRCNLGCAYCFYADQMSARDDLPTGAWLSFFNELGKLGVMTVCLTGGEVFTRPDLFELVDRLIANRMRYQILTNATLVTEKTVSQFDVGKRRQRLDSIQVSVDGSNEKIHNLSRPNSFSRTINGLRLLKDAGLPISVRVTINRYNVEDLENIAHLLLDELGLACFSTNEAYACGATNRYEAGIMLEPRQRNQAMEALTGLAERYPGRIQAQAGPLVLAREKAAMKRAISEGKDGFPGRGCLSACGGVFSQMAVLHDGTLVPCHNLSTLHLGKMQQDDIGETWRIHPLMVTLRERRRISLDSIAACQECTYRGFCTGGCPGGALFLSGDMNNRNPMDCYRILMGEESYPANLQGDPPMVLPAENIQ